MADNERISDIIDLAAAQSQVDALLALLKKADDQIKSTNALLSQPGAVGNIADYKKYADELEKQNNRIITSQQKMVAAREQAAATILTAEQKVIQAINNTASAEKKRELAELNLQNAIQKTTDKKKQQIDTIIEATKTMDDETDAMKKNGTVVSEAEKQYAQLTSSAAAMGRTIAANRPVLEKEAEIEKDITAAKKNLHKANAERNVDLQGYRIQSTLANKAAKEEAMQSLGLVNAYQALSKRYLDAAMNAKVLGAELGRESPIYKAAAMDANKLGKELKALDSDVGQHGRGVGDYAGGIEKAFSKVWSGIRQIAYIVPGLGIGGIMAGLFEGVSAVVQSLDLFKKNDATKAIEGQTNALKESETEYVKAATMVNTLRINIALAKDGLLDKKAVLNEYNNTLGKATGQVKSLDEAEQALVKNGEAYVHMMLYKAAATIAQEAAAKKLYEAEMKRLEDEKKFAKLSDELQGRPIGAMAIDNMSPELYNKRVQENDKRAAERRKARREQAAKDLENESNIQQGIAIKFQKDAADIAKKFKFDFFGGEKNSKDKPEKPTAPVANRYDFTEDQRKANDKLLQGQADYERETYQRLLNSLKRIADEEKNSYQDRIVAMQEMQRVEQKMAEAARDKQLVTVNSKLDEIDKLNQAGGLKQIDQELENVYKIEEMEVKKRTSAQKTALTKKDDLVKDKKLLLEEAGLRQEKVNIIQTTDDKITEIIAAGAARRTALTLAEVNNTAKNANLDIDIKGIEEEMEMLGRLHRAYESGKITIEKYNKEKNKLADLALLSTLRDQLNVLNNQRDAYIKLGKDTREIDKQMAQNRKRQQEIGFKAFDDDAKDSLDHFKKTFGEVADIAKQVMGIVGKAMDAQFTARKNQIQETEDTQQQSYIEEEKRIQSLIISDAEKADKLKILESKRKAQAAANAAEQKKVDQEKAKFDKKMAIFSIIINTAAAVVKALPNIPLAIAAGVLGGAELAVAIGTEVPKYAGGRDNGPAEWALTDENGPEMYVRKDGSMYMGNNRPTYRFLQQDERVIPHHEWKAQEDALQGRMFVDAGGTLKVDNTGQKLDELKNLVAWQTGELKKAYKEKQAPVVNIINNNKWGDYIQENVKS